MSSNPPEKPKAETQFEQLIAEEKADKLRQDEALKNQKSHVSRNQKIAFGAVGGATALLIVAILIYDPFTGALRFGDGEDQTRSQVPSNSSIQQPDWWQEPANAYPIALEDWQMQTFNNGEAVAPEANTGSGDKDTPAAKENVEELYSSIEAYYSGKALESYALTLPSEASGFTSDPAAEKLEDGTLNPMFSYWTKELFVQETGAMLERLINPTFGNWAEDSNRGRLTNITYNALSDLFSQKWLANNLESSKLPVFVPPATTEISYLPEGEQRWVGEVKNVTIDFAYDMSIRNYRVTLVTDIVYTSWTQDQEKVTENAEIRLFLVPNQNEYENGSANHIVIDESQIEVKAK